MIEDKNSNIELLNSLNHINLIKSPRKSYKLGYLSLLTPLNSLIELW